MRERVVVTGLGVISPIGNNVNDFWTSVKEGKTGIGPLTYFDTDGYRVSLAAQVKDFNATDYMNRKDAKRMELFCQYAVAAAKQALEHSGINMENEDPFRVGVSVGSGIGSLQMIEKEEKRLMEKGMSKVSPLFVPMMISNMAARNVSIQFGCRGKSTNVVTACATGTHAIGEAYRSIQMGEADVMLAGGTEAAICPLGIAGFGA